MGGGKKSASEHEPCKHDATPFERDALRGAGVFADAELEEIHVILFRKREDNTQELTMNLLVNNYLEKQYSLYFH